MSCALAQLQGTQALRFPNILGGWDSNNRSHELTKTSCMASCGRVLTKSELQGTQHRWVPNHSVWRQNQFGLQCFGRIRWLGRVQICGP